MAQTQLSKKTFPKKLLLQALAGEATPQVPFWLMRQAGRYLPEYRALRDKAGSFLNLCFNPAFAAEATLQPLLRFDMDAAILFSDILVVPYALGQKLEFVEGEGPRLGALQDGEINFESFDEKLSAVYETVRQVRKSLPEDKALIGFAGGVWTVACYMVQGRGDGEFKAVKNYAFDDPERFDRLIDKLVQVTSRTLIGQISAGADAVQIFDSWAGLLPQPWFDRWVTAPTQKIIANIHREYPGLPGIGFPRQAGNLYQSYAEKTGVCCIGIDQDFSLKKAIQSFAGIAVQGNLDPALLLAGGRALEEGTRRILEDAADAPFIFNLGHGVIKETPPEHVAQLAEILKAHRR